MNARRLRATLTLAAALATAGTAPARMRAPLPDTAFDAGIYSAESLGRGGTVASNRATPAAGSENPAALDAPAGTGALYATTLVGIRTDLPDGIAENSDPLHGKVLQYLSVNADKGVLYFEPVSRLHEMQIVDPATGRTRDVQADVNAIGFAGASKVKGGSFGLSIAYLWSTINVTERTGAQITEVRRDTMDGVRMNLGFRYPTGPAMWGLLIQNGPGFLWGSEFRREQLPLRIRVGNTYRLSKGILFSIDGERRFYREGGEEEDYVYVGNESFLNERMVLRFGAFGTSLSDSSDRHLTAGLSFSAESGTMLTYAIESFRIGDETVKRSILSVQLPFVAATE